MRISANLPHQMRKKKSSKINGLSTISAFPHFFQICPSMRTDGSKIYRKAEAIYLFNIFINIYIRICRSAVSLV